MNPDSNHPHELRSKTYGYPLKNGDIFSMHTQGGGGYGSPAERDRKAIEKDLREGKISEKHAKAEYGWS
jgi:N-methylhydantoinase B